MKRRATNQDFSMKLFKTRSRRGLGTVVTTAILLSAVAVMGIFIVDWSQANLTTHQAKLDSTLSSNLNKLNEKVIFEYIWFDANTTPPNNIVNITMNNVGTVGLNVTKIELVDPTLGTTLATNSLTNGGMVSRSTLSVNFTYTWTTNTVYDIIATTDRDLQFKTQAVSP